MRTWQIRVVRGVAIAVVFIPSVLALITPDAGVWGGGKGGRGH